jgi:integrase
LRPLRFHDLRHTFCSLAINAGSLTEVQHWAGHSDSRTTQRYLHYKARADEARRLAVVFTSAGDVASGVADQGTTGVTGLA